MNLLKRNRHYLYDNKEHFKLSKFEIEEYEKDSKYNSEQTPIIKSKNSIGY